MIRNSQVINVALGVSREKRWIEVESAFVGVMESSAEVKVLRPLVTESGL